MANALERYCTILSRSAVEDPDLKRRQTQKNGGTLNASPNGKRKLTFSVKKLRKSKDVPVDPDELRFSPEVWAGGDFNCVYDVSTQSETVLRLVYA